MCEAAVFQAPRRDRVDLAEAWLADVPMATVVPAIRQMGEAAILEGKGDSEGARRRLDDVEKLIRSRPALPGRDVSLRLLRRWNADLANGAT
jgi:hypothetical protein